MPVRWRIVLVGAFSLLLPVPLVLLLNQGLLGEFSSGGAAERRFSPMLSLEERRKLLTFDHVCRGSQDCEPPLGCLQDFRRFKMSVCIGSECEMDIHCPDGQVCRPVKTQGTGPLVRLCVATGKRKEGQGCDRLPSQQEEACEPGLLCNRGYCGRPCQLGEPMGCPQDFVCGEGPEVTSCLPSCEEGQCPEGQDCVHFEGGFAACARVKGRNCTGTPCPQGQECRIGYTPGVGDEVTMECRVPCDEQKSSCPAGSVCFFGYCSRVCDPTQEGACGPDEFCNLHKDPNTRERFWFCSPRNAP
jgi:hypothetical protein